MPGCEMQGVGVVTGLEAEASTDEVAKFSDYSLMQLATDAALWEVKKLGVGVAMELEAEASTDEAAKFPDYSLLQLATAVALWAAAKPPLDSFLQPVVFPQAPVQPVWA
jgi:hypothetical protein